MKTSLISAGTWLPTAIAAAVLFTAMLSVGETVSVRTNYNALVLYYNPHVLKDGQLRPYKETYGARDIDELCRDYVKFVKRASGGQVNWTVAYRYELDEFPPDNDPNVTFTPENYDAYRSSGFDFWDHGKPNYLAFCQDSRFGIVPKVEAMQVDSVWVFAPECTGFWETAMAGNGAFYANGGAYPEIVCSRKFIIYGFGSSAHQGVGFMLENTGHMMEVIMRDRIAVGWPMKNEVKGWTTLDLTNPDRGPATRWLNDWNLFVCTDGMHWDPQLVAPAHSQCGLSHFPPTACENYGWADPAITFLPWEAENFLYLDALWSVVDRVLYVTNVEPVVAKAMMNGTHSMTDSRGSYRVPVALTDFDVEADVCVLSGNATASAGVVFRCSRYADGLGRQDGYYVGLQPGRDKVQLYRLGPTQGHTLLQEIACPLEPNMNYTLLVSLRGSNMTARLGPHQPAILNWESVDIDFGGIGLGACGGEASFSNLNLTPIIPNYAESWRSYPNPQGAPRALSASEWAGDYAPYTEMDYFYAWWYEHLPKRPGTHEVRAYGDVYLGTALNSWWPYMYDINVFSTPFLPEGATVQCPPGDASPPDAPSGLAGVGLTGQEILLEWSEPTDNIGVTRYEVFRDGALAARVATKSFRDRNLEPGSSHDYAVRALDGSGNISPLSQTLRASTGAPGELFRNGSFEQGLSYVLGWEHGAYSLDAVMQWEPQSSGRFGSKCISITAPTPNDAWWIQEITGLVPSSRYLVSCWIKGSNVVMEPGGHSGASIGDLTTWDYSARLLTGTFDWTPVSCYLYSDGAGRLTLTCRLGHHGSLTIGKAWYDDVQLVYAPVMSQPVFSWGAASGGLATAPSGIENARALSCGDSHALALVLSGRVLGWGDNTQGQSEPPWGLAQVRAIAAGGSHSLALLHDGGIIGWGNNTSGQCAPPDGVSNFVALAAGGTFSMGLRADGQVFAWGDNSGGQRSVPAGLPPAVWIAAGKEFGAALLANGTVRAWGRYLNDSGIYAVAGVPAGISNVIEIACGQNHMLAVLADGTVRAWGRTAEGQITIPAGLSNVIDVAAGAMHSLALQQDGTVACWGNSPSAPAAATNVFAIAAGQGFSIALVQARPPQSGCKVHRSFKVGNMLQIDTAVPEASPGFLLKSTNLENGGAWSVSEARILPTGQLAFTVPLDTSTGFCKVKSRPW